jgi:hypothetical protein
MYASIPEFVQKLFTLTAKASTDPINSDAVTKLVNGFVKSVCREKNEQEKQKKKEKKEAKKAKKEAKKAGKVKKSETDKPLNAYMLYCIAKRQSIVGVPENRGKPPKEITAILAKEWRKERDQGSEFFNELQQQADDASAKYKKAKEKEKEKEKTESINEKVSTPKKMKKEEKEKVPDAPKKEKKEKAKKKA